MLRFPRHWSNGARRRLGKAFSYQARAKVDVTNALQPVAQRQGLILPSGVVNEIKTTTGRLQRKSVLDQLRHDLLGGVVNDTAVHILTFLIGLLSQGIAQMDLYL